MDKVPKRRKSNDNPYTLVIENNKYYVLFDDSKYILHKIEISESIFEAFNRFELEDKKILNEFARHIEHSEIYEDKLNVRSNYKSISIEDEIIRKSTFEEVMKAIELLPNNQRRRIKKYYFDGKNEYEIAKEEGTTHQAVNKSLKNAKEKLRKILKN